MKLSRFGIYLILGLFIAGLGGGYVTKYYIIKPTSVIATTIKPNETKPKVEPTNIEEDETVTDKDITSGETKVEPEKTETLEEDTTETLSEDSKVEEKKKPSDKDTLANSKYSYILVAGLSASLNLQNTLVGLYNTELKTITYLPYDYYIEQYEENKDVSIGNLTIDQIRDYLTTQGVKIIDQVNIDQDIIFDLFTSTMSGDEYIITYIDEKGEKVEMPIKTKAHLYNLISKDNLNQYKNLEQLHNTIIDLLLKNNVTVSKVFKDAKDIKLTQEELYKTGSYLSITEKSFDQKQINGKFFSIDSEHKYLKALVSGDFTAYGTELTVKKQKEEEEKKIVTPTVTETKTETLQQKLERLKKEREQLTTSSETQAKTESLADRLKRLREQNQ